MGYRRDYDDIEYNHHVGDGFADLEEVTDDDE